MATANKMRILVVDGYNVIHRSPELSAKMRNELATAREALAKKCRVLVSERAVFDTFILVFDGSGRNAGNIADTAGGTMIFTRTGQSADDKILEFVAALGNPRKATVVSDDTYVARKARLLSATVISVRSFLKQAEPAQSRTGQHSPGNDKSLTPAEIAGINAELKGIWGD